MSYKNTQHSGTSHGSIKIYLIGLISSIILTFVPFYMVTNSTASHDTRLWIVIGTAITQIMVHLVCFLHMNTSSDDHWNLVAFLFTMLIIGVVVIGSLWIMHNLNINMMLD
ncbi:Cytochrome bo(3) ubiquinol oxidase subunit 4 [Arsenophonus endosymbiont of Aleurodicus dispersus]|uniref:cytochrome o ubiquinol oxidase subunit IV n=1 Tax=Arsenophonus endosymbiont of Aleurodicus dispersus TaxID=235559 RepID=UPI000EAB8262|nr:cytochrome o ubiquinol oxidase subunit IV [Arsenophonus endosymbiont of Aleurodicus dispersus]VAY02145.1 Cytochrome bo(3) ubiquinol oxidase subunit 4 [Arsenophonus endosymbiont of Aleurodicus dispersus]